jgi:hypothetical protein
MLRYAIRDVTDSGGGGVRASPIANCGLMNEAGFAVVFAVRTVDARRETTEGACMIDSDQTSYTREVCE